MAISIEDRIKGLMTGTAVGDALGLPGEGISKRRIRKLFKGRWRHRFVLGRGMISDDTEHTLFTAQCLLKHSSSPEKFGKRLAWCLRLWFLCLPAGIGLATVRGIIKLWMGFPPEKSGVFSAGNGPAMRVAPIGAFFSSSPEDLDRFVKVSTTITHTDPKALTGSLAVARLTAWIINENMEQRPDRDDFIQFLRGIDENDPEWKDLINEILSGIENNLSVEQFAAELGLEKGITGYMYHTVPVVLFAWYTHFGDYEKSLASILDCGGDTDTTGAIVGALSGAVTGDSGIPDDWICGLKEWPRSIMVVRRAGEMLARKKEHGERCSPVRYFWPGILLRNIIFLFIVLAHGFRRIMPPY